MDLKFVDAASAGDLSFSEMDYWIGRASERGKLTAG